MFRIQRVDYARGILISIEGRLTGDFVEIAEQTCDEALSTNKAVVVFLRDVLEIDGSGRAFLERIAAKKARLRAIGLYSRYLVRKLQR